MVLSGDLAFVLYLIGPLGRRTPYLKGIFREEELALKGQGTAGALFWVVLPRLLEPCLHFCFLAVLS